MIQNKKINRRFLLTSFFSFVLYNMFNFTSHYISSNNFVNQNEEYLFKFINLIPKKLIVNEINMTKKLKSKNLIENLINKDFQNKNFIIVDGWFVSKIEASIIYNKYNNYVS